MTTSRCTSRWEDVVRHACEGHRRGVVEHRCPCGAARNQPSACATCEAVARHPHLRCEDQPFDIKGDKRPIAEEDDRG